MSARVIQMLDTYKKLHKETGKSQPKMKLASFISAKEAMAAAEFGCHSVTVSTKILDELAALEYDGTKQPGAGIPKPDPAVEFYQHAGPTPSRLQALVNIDPLAAAEWDGKLASTQDDYLANGGVALEKAINSDPIAKSRLEIALETFTEAENKSKQKIEGILASL